MRRTAVSAWPNESCSRSSHTVTGVRHDGARDMAHWLGMRYGISDWKAHRWIAAAHALEDLPLLSEAFSPGELGIDKVVELTRFATAKTEARLIPWARGGCPGGASGGRATWPIGPWRRPEGQSTPRPCPGGTSRRTPGSGCPRSSPRPQGAVVARALERLAETLPVMPGEEEDSYYVQARRADALVALCSAPMAQDTRPRPGHGGHPRPAGRARLRGGWVCHRGRPGHPPRDRPAPAVSRRVQMVIEDSTGQPVGLGRTSRDPRQPCSASSGTATPSAPSPGAGLP